MSVILGLYCAGLMGLLGRGLRGHVGGAWISVYSNGIEVCRMFRMVVRDERL